MKGLKLIALTSFLLLVIVYLNDAARCGESERLDQEQTKVDMEGKIYGKNWLAQSFKPTLGKLTRIELCLARNGDIQTNLTVGIREHLTGKDIVSLCLSSSQIDKEQKWINLNLTKNISMNVEKTYYIICRTTGGDENNFFIWYGGINTTYKRGMAYISKDNGQTWQQQIDADYAFKTYGIGVGQLTFTYIFGTLGGEIKFGIKNIGTQRVRNITVTMKIKGFVLIGKEYNHTFRTTLLPGRELRSSIRPIVGLGPAEIVMSASSPDVSKGVVEKREAFLLPFYVYIGPQ